MNERPLDPTGSTESGGVDETERDVITSGTAATSEIGDFEAQADAERRPGGPDDRGEPDRETVTTEPRSGE